MSMKYLFTNEELSFLKRLVKQNLLMEKNTMYPAAGLKNIDAREQESDESRQISGLLRKGYVSMDGDTLVLEPLTMTFAMILSEPCQTLELPDGILYDGGDILLWIEEDQRKVYGKTVSAYPTLKEWYRSVSDEKERTYTLIECERKLKIT